MSHSSYLGRGTSLALLSGMNEKIKPNVSDLFEVVTLDEKGENPEHISYHRTNAAANKRAHSVRLNWPGVKVSVRLVQK